MPANVAQHGVVRSGLFLLQVFVEVNKRVAECVTLIDRHLDWSPCSGHSVELLDPSVQVFPLACSGCRGPCRRRQLDGVGSRGHGVPLRAGEGASVQTAACGDHPLWELTDEGTVSE